MSDLIINPSIMPAQLLAFVHDLMRDLNAEIRELNETLETKPMIKAGVGMVSMEGMKGVIPLFFVGLYIVATDSWDDSDHHLLETYMCHLMECPPCEKNHAYWEILAEKLTIERPALLAQAQELRDRYTPQIDA